MTAVWIGVAVVGYVLVALSVIAAMVAIDGDDDEAVVIGWFWPLGLPILALVGALVALVTALVGLSRLARRAGIRMREGGGRA